MSSMTDLPSDDIDRGPQNHRTIDRVTQILEQVVYNPGMTFAELSRALDAPKSSVHGFIRGLLAAGWLYQESNRFYLGPALYGLTLAGGHLRAGSVTDADLQDLHQATGVTVFLGVTAGDHLIYVSEVGVELLAGFAARTNIRRNLLETAGGKALLAEASAERRDSYLRRRSRDRPELVEQFLGEFDEIKQTRIARNFLHNGARFGLATVVHNQLGSPVAEVTLVGRADSMLPREKKLQTLLLKHVDQWQQRGAPRR